jgi:transcriptional regulator with XRE-family HTH domain
MEPVIDFLRRRLRDAGPRRWERIAAECGLSRRTPARLVYGERDNPTISTVQPLLDYFDAVDRGERVLPDPDIDPRYLPQTAESHP